MKNQTLSNIGRILFLSMCLCLLNAAPFVDPTQPATYKVTTHTNTWFSALTLHATFLYPTQRYAIINNTLYKLGDNVGQYTIMSISAYSVELKGANDTREVLLLVPPIGQTAVQ